MSFPTNDSSYERDAPEPGLSLVDAVMAETIGMAMHNAVAAQNQMRMMGAAAVTAACVRMIKASGGTPPLLGLPPVIGPIIGPGDEAKHPHVVGTKRVEEVKPVTRRPRAAEASELDDAQAEAEDAVTAAQGLQRLAV